MKTLILNGSTRLNGDTEALIREFASHLTGEIKIISYRNDIKPCSDCRFCWSHEGCSINDEMQEIYPFVEDCDNIVIASPIWFASLSGPLLNIASRLQTMYSSIYFRNAGLNIKKKNGAILITGARKGTEVMPTKAVLTIMKCLNVSLQCVEKVYSLDTDRIPAEKDEAALAECRRIAELFNASSEN